MATKSHKFNKMFVLGSSFRIFPIEKQIFNKKIKAE